jgi:hypothetical protein
MGTHLFYGLAVLRSAKNSPRQGQRRATVDTLDRPVEAARIGITD